MYSLKGEKGGVVFLFAFQQAEFVGFFVMVSPHNHHIAEISY
jgi:hypothetical protein